MYARISAPLGLYDDDGGDKGAVVKDVTSKDQTKQSQSVNCPEDTLIKSQDEKPKNVSKHLWEKFKMLEKRTDDVTRRSTEKRIKHLQKQALIKVQEEITHPDDLDILREHDVRLGPPNIRGEKSDKKRKTCDKAKDGSSSSLTREWQKVRGLITVNDHLKGIDRGKHAPKTQLEKRVDAAVAEGDVQKAEELSDQLATREFGKKIADAIDARNYLQDKKKEDESVKAKKRKKLHWGFEHKQRWETKGNM